MIMKKAVIQLEEAFRAGREGLSVRDVRLDGRTPTDLHRRLRASGFVHRRLPMLAERTVDGAPTWCLADGTSTLEPMHPETVPIDEYTHRDGGLVRVYPLGDPRGRDVPAGAAYAMKYVTFPGSPARHGVPSRFEDLAFRLTDAGKPISKSRRHVHGTSFDPARLFASWRFAEQELATAAAIQLGRE